MYVNMCVNISLYFRLKINFMLLSPKREIKIYIPISVSFVSWTDIPPRHQSRSLSHPNPSHQSPSQTKSTKTNWMSWSWSILSRSILSLTFQRLILTFQRLILSWSILSLTFQRLILSLTFQRSAWRWIDGLLLPLGLKDLACGR